MVKAVGFVKSIRCLRLLVLYNKYQMVKAVLFCITELRLSDNKYQVKAVDG